MATPTSQSQPLLRHVSHTEAVGSHKHNKGAQPGHRTQEGLVHLLEPPEFNNQEPFQAQCLFSLLRQETPRSFPKILEEN